MAATALIAMAGLQLYQGFMQSSAIRQQAEYARRMTEINGRRADMAARDAILRGEAEAVKYGQKVSGFVGSQKAALAAQGIEISTGDASKLIEETRLAGSQNVAKIRMNAFRESLGIQVEQVEAERRARWGSISAEFEAGQTMLGAGLRAGMTAYQAYSSYKKGE